MFRIIIPFVLAAVLPVFAQAGGHKMYSSDAAKIYYPDAADGYVGNIQSMYPQHSEPSSASADVTTAIEKLVEEFASRWTKATWTSIPELWDRAEEAPYLLLAHQPDWLVGWDQIDGYFAQKQTMPKKEIPEQAPPGLREIEAAHYEYRAENDLQEMMYTADRITVRRIDTDLAVAVWYVDFQYKPIFKAAKGEHFKANAMFRETNDGWKFIHYAEAPMSAIMYMERLYRTQTSPAFQKKLEEQNAAMRAAGQAAKQNVKK